MTLKRTPLFPLYEKYGGKTIDFGGWELPVQFSSIKEEHEAVRTKAGIFDVSHMGEIIVKGKDSLAFLQKLLTNDFSTLQVGAARYTAMCYENGGTIDDLLVYRLGEEEFFLVVNAANTEKDYEWLKEHTFGEVEIINISDETSLIALQGPLAENILALIVGEEVREMGPFKFRKLPLLGKEVIVSRTGYTGEDGFEIYCDNDIVTELWEKLIEVGSPQGLLPCGLGARDTLRFEACLPLYGQELSSDISPLEAGIGFCVKVQKEEDFIGKESLKKQKEEGVTRKIVGLEMIGRGIPRTGYPVWKGEEQIGHVTTGTQSPTLKKNIGLALLALPYTEENTEIEVEIRGKKIPAKVIPTPFYKRTK